MKMTKILALVLAILMMATVMIACNGGKQPEEKVHEIKLWVSTTDGVKAFFEKQVADFKAAHPEYKFNITIETVGEGDTRVVLRFHPALAPVKAAVLPLSKKLSDKAGELCDDLAKAFNVEFDEAGSIGKRYRRQDEIGTPFCITYDFDTENDGCVTVRDRDTMEQIRMPISEVKAYIASKLEF